MASEYLQKTLERLKEIGCISDYQGSKITNDNNQKITLYSPCHSIVGSQEEYLLDGAV